MGNYMNHLKPVRLRDLRTQAAFILKDLAAPSSRCIIAAKKIQQLPLYADKSLDWITTHGKEIKLKYAYAALAIDYGFKNWDEFKHSVAEKDCLYCPAAVGFIYAWFADYDAAEAYHAKHGGCLLSFWADIIVCGDEYVRETGLQRHEVQWKKIGYNWVRPADPGSFQILKNAAINTYLKKNEG